MLIGPVLSAGRLLRRRLGREEGQALVFVAFGLVAMVGFLGLVVDVSRAYVNHKQMQTAADAAALAGAYDVVNNLQVSVGADASAYSQKNGGPVLHQCAAYPDTTDTNCWANPYVDKNGGIHPDQVEVRISSSQPTLIARVVGINQLSVATRAVASLTTGGQAPPISFATLQSDGENHTLLIQNGSTLHVAANMYTDSCDQDPGCQPPLTNHGDAFDVFGGGGTIVDDKDINIVGGWETKNNNPVGANGGTCVSGSVAYSPIVSLSAGVDAATTSIPIKWTANKPDPVSNNDVVTINGEQMFVTNAPAVSTGTATLTVKRAYNGTAGATHALNDAVNQMDVVIQVTVPTIPTNPLTGKTASGSNISPAPSGGNCPKVNMPYIPDPFAFLPQPTPGVAAGGPSVAILRVNRVSQIATAVTNVASSFAVGDTVRVTGVGSGFDGAYTVASVPSPTTFTYDNSQGSAGCVPAGCPDLPVITNKQMTGGAATLTTNAPGTTLTNRESDLGVFGLDSIFNIPGSNGTVTAAGTTSSTFSYQVPLANRTFNVNQMGLQQGAATLALNSTAGLAANDTVDVSGVDSRLNGTGFVLTGAGGGTITYADPATTQYSISSAAIIAGTASSTTVQVTNPLGGPNNIFASDQVGVTGSGDSRINGTFSAGGGGGAGGSTTFTYDVIPALVATTTGNKSATGGTITLTANAAPPFRVSDTITVNTGFLAYDGTNLTVTGVGTPPQKTFTYAAPTFTSTAWTQGGPGNMVTVTTGANGTKNGLSNNDTVSISGFDAAHSCLSVGNVAVQGANNTSFKFAPPTGCAPTPVGGGTNPQVTLVKTNAGTAGAGNAFETSGSSTASCTNCVTAPGFIPANSTASGSAVLTAVPATPVSGTFSPAWMPPAVAGLAAAAGGSPASPSPLEISAGNVRLNPGTYYGGICLGAASGNDCVGTHCDPSVASSPTVHLNDGIYIMAGGGFKVCGHATLDAPHVLIYSTNDPSASVVNAYSPIGQFEVNTAGTVTLGPQPSDQPYGGFVIWEDRSQVVDPVAWGNNPTAYTTPQSLTSGISDSEEVLNVTGAALGNGITAGNVIVIGSEMMIVREVSDPPGNTIVVQRGYDGTTAAAHASGTAVKEAVYGGAACKDKVNNDSNFDIAFLSAGIAAGNSGPLDDFSGTVYAAGPRADIENSLFGSANLAVITSCVYINSGDVPGAASNFIFDTSGGGGPAGVGEGLSQ